MRWVSVGEDIGDDQREREQDRQDDRQGAHALLLAAQDLAAERVVRRIAGAAGGIGRQASQLARRAPQRGRGGARYGIMSMKEIAREIQGKVANLALRMPISWVNILAGPPIAVDGRTLDGRTQWFL